MSGSENQINGKWTEIKGEIQKAWGKLTNDELEKTKGDAKAIGGLIQQRYGEAEETYGRKVSDIFSRFAEKKEELTDAAKRNLKN